MPEQIAYLVEVKHLWIPLRKAIKAINKYGKISLTEIMGQLRQHPTQALFFEKMPNPFDQKLRKGTKYKQNNFTLDIYVSAPIFSIGPYHFNYEGTREQLDAELRIEANVLNTLGFRIEYLGYKGLGTLTESERKTLDSKLEPGDKYLEQLAALLNDKPHLN